MLILCSIHCTITLQDKRPKKLDHKHQKPFADMQFHFHP
jgi:hypothetical protein